MTRGTWLCFCFGLLALLAVAARGEIITWTGAASTNWHASGNWTNASGVAAIPATGDDVIVNGGPRQPTLSVAAGATNINSLSIGANNASTLSVAHADADLKKLIVAGAVTIGGSGVLTHFDNSTGEVHRLNVQIGGDLTISAGGKIDVTALGYDATKGPGYDTSAGSKGGAYGGQGRGYNNPVYFASGQTYGSATHPTRLGSGGTTSAGGGAVILQVTGTTTVQGSILADGTPTGTNPGSGGSVFLTTGTLSGNGTIRANGWGPSTGAGGGGRLAIVVTNGTDAGSVTLNAYGGAGGYIAAAGTIFVKTRNDTYGRIIVDNNGKFIDVQGANGALEGMTGLDSPSGVTTCRFDRIAVTNCGILLIRTNVVLDVSNLPGWVCDSTTNNLKARLVFAADEGTFAFPADYTFTNIVLCQKGTGTVSWAGSITLGPGTILTHEKGAYTSTDERHKLNLAIGGNLAIQTGGVIWALGNGYAPAKGPGYQAMSVSAGAYGGQGGGYTTVLTPCGTPYGSLTRPTNLGSGGGNYAGGGAVVLGVSGTATVNGVILANAFTNTSKTGSGGTVFITAASLAGNGLIEASSFGTAGAGGGGRIALVMTNDDAFGSVTLNAKGGASASYNGAGGTIYLKRKSDAFGKLVVDNHTNATTCLTLITSNVTDTAVGDVEIRSSGRLGLAALQPLLVHGAWSNAGVFAASAGSLVTLAGTNAATVWGSTNTVFAGLACTSPAKRVEFAANKTVTVTNSLAFTGGAGAGNLLVLRSTTNGVSWKLTVKAGSAQSVSYADVRDSDAGAGDPIATSDAVDSGNNTNWNFAVAGPITWTGGSNTLWGEGGNWDLGRPPIPTDTEIIIAPAARQPVLDAHRDLANGLFIQAGASLALNGYNLSIGGSASVTGSLIAAGSEVIAFRNQATFASAASFTPALSTVRFYPDGAQTVSPGGASFHRVEVSNQTVSVFTDGFRASEVVFHAASTGATFQGSFTSGLFRCEAPSAALTFKGGGAFAVTNLMLRGTNGAAIQLRSTSGGSAWSLAVSGWRFARYVDVRDSDASFGKQIQALDSTDSGNNPNWDFGVWKTWQGGVSGEFTNGANWAGGEAPGETGSVLLDVTGPYMPVITQATALTRLTIGPSLISTLTANTNLTITEDLLVMEHGKLTHSANPAGTNEPYKLRLTVGGDMTVLAGGKVDATAKGFPANMGPGAATNLTIAGAAYGGQGQGYLLPNSVPSGQCYGSILRPTALGSGGPQRAGGGAVRLDVAGTLELQGVIKSEGDPANSAYLTGSGGSVWLKVGRLAGTGLVSVASYGNGGGGGAGGGGRIAVEVTNGIGFGQVSFSARGGEDVGYRAAAGTVYLRHAGDSIGRVMIDNAAVLRGVALTQLPAPLQPVTDELKAIPLVITNTSWVGLTADFRIGDILVDTNSLLSVSAFVLRVQAPEHHLTDSLVPGQGGTNQVDFYDQILWKQVVGTVIMIK
jgi:hypothetical protein